MNLATCTKSLALLCGVLAVMLAVSTQAQAQTCLEFAAATCQPEPSTDDDGHYIAGNGFSQAEVDQWVFCCCGSQNAIGTLTNVHPGTGGGGVGANGIWDRLMVHLGDDLIARPAGFLGTKAVKNSELGARPGQYSRTNISRTAEITVTGIGESLMGEFTAQAKKGVLLQVKLEGSSQTLYALAIVSTPATQVTQLRTVNGVNAFLQRNFGKDSNFALVDSLGNIHRFVSSSATQGGGSFTQDSTAAVATVILRQYDLNQ